MSTESQIVLNQIERAYENAENPQDVSLTDYMLLKVLTELMERVESLEKEIVWLRLTLPQEGQGEK